jgi:sphingosine kinase
MVCSYFCIKGQTLDIDLVEFETISSDTKIYSFLSLAFGFIADVDLESEVYRINKLGYDVVDL